MNVIHRLIPIILILGASASPAAAQVSGSHSACAPEFSAKAPWMGADAAYSIPLPDGRDVWIFGDTLYGDKRVVRGNDPEMVNNTLGISTCKNGKWDLKYVIRRGNDGKFASFFTPQHPKTWYWALDGVYYKGDLWVTLLCVRALPNSNSFALGFEGCGADLAHITGIKDPNPEKWKITYHELVPDGVKSYPTATAVVHEDNIYIFSVNDFGDRALVVTRIPGSGLNDPKKNLQYLAADGTWKPGFDPKNANPVMAKGTSELSIRFHPELKKWVAVSIAPDWPTDKFILRTAENLIGPWSDAEMIYQAPEMQKSTPGYDPDVFCYAGKEHPEFEKPGDLLFTYVCNVQKPSKLPDLPNIYIPQVVRKKMPAIK